MGKYAEGTEVSAEKSKVEIEKTLERYGASSFASGWREGQAVIVFEAHKKRLKFVLPLPDRKSEEFTHHMPRGAWSKQKRTDQAAQAKFDQEVRRRWRCLALAIKAKLEVVSSGISTFEEEFMAHVVLPDGQTVAEWMGPQIDHVYKSGQMPPLLGPGGGR